MEPKVSVLIVEDEEKIRTGLKDFLEFHDFGVVEASDGLEAQRLVNSDLLDAIEQEITASLANITYKDIDEQIIHH